MPLTSTGEHPRPISGLIAPRRLSSSLNQPAHSGTTGNPNRWAMRYEPERRVVVTQDGAPASKSAPDES